MESKAKVLGHPIHPILITVPLGLFVTAVAFDLLGLLTGNKTFARVAFWNIAGGLLGGLAAAVPGAIDWAHLPDGTRAKRVGAVHGLGNVAVLLLFAVSWLLRRDDPETVEAPAFLSSLAGLGLGTATGWLGGELVARLGVGVDEGAHLNAPSSLSGRPAAGEAGDQLRERELGG